MIWVGTSGYDYPEWRGSFYPHALPAADRLAFYAERFRTLEINSTSYRLPAASSLRGWADGTPPDFKLALKVPRWITYADVSAAARPLRTFVERAGLLDDKLGPVLLQLPVGLARPGDDGLLKGLLDAVPGGVRAAVELRDASWHADAVFDLLRQRGIALCISDSEELATPVVRTAGFGYFRLRNSGYTQADLAAWAAHLRAFDGEVFVYFKHESTGSGPRLACELLRHLGTPAE